MVNHGNAKSVVNLVIVLLMIVLFVGLAEPSDSVSATAQQTSLNCTFTEGYWKNHPEAWPVTSLSIGGVTYNQQQLLAILSSSNTGDATYALAQQLIAAKLNIANGADGSAIFQVITQADTFLAAHPLGSTLSKSDRSTAIKLANNLDQYNSGKIGPGACKENTPTNTPTNTATVVPTTLPTDLPTLAPTIVPTIVPTGTP